MAYPENALTLDILPLSADTARLVRVYGTEPCIALPGTLPAPEGGSFAVTELGDYCFSEKPRSLPAADKTCRYEAAPDGTARLTRAFGQAVGGICRRYDFDFDAPAAGSDADDLHPVCGNFLEELTLPDSLQVVGSCAFYNCRKLRLLTVGTGSLTMGSDVFLNCFALETIRVQAGPEEPTGLFALVNNITEAVRAEFCPAGTAAPLAALWYPAYWEDIEETPAHILLHTFSGQGYHYRQCFLNNIFLPAEYDSIFPQGHDADDANVMAMLCFDRLRYPWQLTEAAAGHYRAFLAANTDRVLARLLKAQDNDAVRALIALDVLDKDGFAEASALAAKAGNAAAAALLSGCAYPGVELDTQVQQKQVLGEIYERTETWPFEKNPMRVKEATVQHAENFCAKRGMGIQPLDQTISWGVEDASGKLTKGASVWLQFKCVQAIDPSAEL